MSLQRLNADAPIETIVTAIRRDGGVVVQRALSPDLLGALQDELAPILEGTPNGMDEVFLGTRPRRASGLFARSPHTAEVALLPVFLDAAKAILQTPVKAWAGQTRVEVVPDLQLSVAQAIQIHPGQGHQPLHRDDTVWMWRHPDYGREARLQIMIAVSKFTADNGGTLVIPGSHRWDDERMPTMEEAVPTEMAAGDALLWVGSTYHGGGTNSSDAPRTGLTIAYDLAMLRQEENQYLSNPIAAVKAMPEELQRLLGWTVNSTFMGWVEIDGLQQDPHVLLTRPEFRQVGVIDPV